MGQAEERRLPFDTLSILYLRCGEDAKVVLKYKDVVKPFNSLFEMRMRRH